MPEMLIEVAMPVKEISAESVRDKSIRHGHISTLHLWWARRPLPVCRAVVFASLVPDPLDKDCPVEFIQAVEKLLAKQSNGTDPYKPYDNIPYTSAIDKMEDNLRNRLLMYIGKFSETYCSDSKLNKKTSPKDMLSDGSLIKWENKDNERVLNIARKLIWVAYDPKQNTLTEFDRCYQAIKKAENDLYNTPDRHLHSSEVESKELALQSAIEEFQNRMPSVFDPFAGGGAIPLEAARLGCRSFGNDINPVAHIIQKGSVEFPQQYGKPIVYTLTEFVNKYGEEVLEHNYQQIDASGNEYVRIENRLAFDVEYYANKLLSLTEAEIGEYYPADENGKKPIAYYWARVATCSNPSCQAEVPLLKQFYLVNRPNKKVHLKPVINNRRIEFEIRNGSTEETGWMNRANLVCPCCGNTTEAKSLKKQFINGTSKERLIAVIWDGNKGKDYKLPRDIDLEIVSMIPVDIEISRPSEPMPVKYTQALPSCTWGLTQWGQMFSPRQLLAMQTLVEKMQLIKEILNPHENDYDKAIVTLVGILIDRTVARLTSFGLWHSGRETLEYPFGRQAIPMVFDYPESNPFCIGSGSFLNQLKWLTRFIDDESGSAFVSTCRNASSGDITQFPFKFLTAVVTDPPYYDAIAYADLSDFFYVWLKRTLGDIYPGNLATPQTPKTEECTALKHRHHGSYDKAKEHFENKLLQIFYSIEAQTSGIVSIMFAHQSTEAWSTLCNSILRAKMNITGSWAIDTEYSLSGLKSDKAFLSSSVTVSCRPMGKYGFGYYSDIKNDIINKVKDEVEALFRLGFRGADLLTSCFGQAVSVFGQYEQVEKADGSQVSVQELLDMTRVAAFDAIVSDINADDVTRFYIGWLNLFGFSEAQHDDVRRITQIGLNIDVNQLIANTVIVRTGAYERIAGFSERAAANSKLGEKGNSFTLDIAHKMMYFYHTESREQLLRYMKEFAPDENLPVWRVLNSLSEVLPKGSSDYDAACGLLVNQESLLKSVKQMKKESQVEIDF